MRQCNTLAAAICALARGKSSFRAIGFTLAFAILIGCGRLSFATTYSGSAYEPFDYASGTQIIAGNNLNGGVGWNATGNIGAANDVNENWGNTNALPSASGSATNPGKTIGSATLSYGAGGYPASSGLLARIDAVAGGNTTNVSRLIGQTVDAGTLYFSYLTRKNNDTRRTTSLAFFGPANGVSGTDGNTAERVSIGQIYTNTVGAGVTDGNIGLLFNNVNSATSNRVVNATSPIAYGVGTTHLIIGRVDFNAAGNDTLTLYVDPSDLSAEPATPYIQTSGFELTSFNSIRLFSGNALTNFPDVAVSADYDEIRLGTTFASVVTAAVPEPSTLSIATFGAMGFIGELRKRAKAGR